MYLGFGFVRVPNHVILWCSYVYFSFGLILSVLFFFFFFGDLPRAQNIQN